MKRDNFLNLHVRMVEATERIANSLEAIVDKKKRVARTIDVERSKVYKTHLGKKLR
jgi:hypothetical protein